MRANHLMLAAGAALVLSPAWAAERLPAETAQPAADYQPGRDARGRPVVAAELPPVPAAPLLGPMDVVVPLAPGRAADSVAVELWWPPPEPERP